MHFLSILYNIAIAMIYATNTYCLGYVAAIPLAKRLVSPLLRFIVRIALGYNIIIFAVHLLGLAGVLNLVVYLFLSILGIILFLILRRDLFFSGAMAVREVIAQTSSEIKRVFAENKLVVTLLVVFIVSLFIISLAPVTKSDELNYFLTFTKRIVTSGALSFDYSQVLMLQPLVQSLWYVPVYGLGAHEAPAILNLLYSLLILFVSYTWLRKFISPSMALLATLATYININALMIYPAPQDNVAAWFWTLSALIATYEFVYPKETPAFSRAHYFAIGLIFATASLVKLSAVPVVFFCLLLISIRMVQNKHAGINWLFLFAPFAIFYAPFLIKSYLWTGSPLFPALAGWFGSSVVDLDAMNVYTSRPATHWQPGLWGIVKTFSNNFLHNLKWNLSPILIFSAPLAFFFLLKSKKYLLSIVFAILFVFFTIATASARLHGGILIFLVLVLFLLAPRLVNQKYVRWLIKLHAGLLVAITIVYAAQFAVFVFGFQSMPDFMRNKVRAYEEIVWANENLPSGSRMIMTTNELYYSDFATYCLDEYPLLLGADMRQFNTPAEIHYFLKKNNITHLFLAETGTDFDAEFRKQLQQVGEQFGRLIYEKENITVRGYRHPLKKPLKGNLKIYSIE